MLKSRFDSISFCCSSEQQRDKEIKYKTTEKETTIITSEKERAPWNLMEL